jgi:membrane protein YqaA with SNARE-associated domain
MEPLALIILLIPLYLLALMSIVDALSITVWGNTLAGVIKRINWKRWLKMAAVIVAFIIVSFFLAYWFNRLADILNLPLDRYAFLAYLIVFVVSIVANLTVIAPVPIAVSVMITVAQNWNPLLAALAAALGGTIGEMSGYFAGYAGRKIAISNDFVNFERIESWINKWGAWAIVFLAFQPIIPFDIGGLIAGAARMPIGKFLPALFAGKFPKYILLAYAGVGLIHFLPASWFS